MIDYQICFFDSLKSYATRSSGSCPKEFVDQLWKLYHEIGITQFKADELDICNTIQWKLNDSWYSTSEIERIKKLKSFL